MAEGELAAAPAAGCGGGSCSREGRGGVRDVLGFEREQEEELLVWRRRREGERAVGVEDGGEEEKSEVKKTGTVAEDGHGQDLKVVLGRLFNGWREVWLWSA